MTTPSPYSALEVLSVLCQGRPDPIKALAEHLLPDLEPVTVVTSRTGLVMLPYLDSAEGAPFHLGEVLACEVHVRVVGGEGYAVCLGRDLEFATALAVIDAALSVGHEPEAIYALVSQEVQHHAAQDAQLLRAVATTRVEMETF
jgi:alpha-D-ribose 1-methylphosphonate 5-triphosphate synthase subunit PhnG